MQQNDASAQAAIYGTSMCDMHALQDTGVLISLDNLHVTFYLDQMILR